MKKICLEEHFSNAEMAKIRKQWYARTGFPQTLDADGSADIAARMADIETYRLPDMDRNEIAVQVLSTGAPAVQGLVEATEAIAKAREFNDYLAELISRHPTRFAGFAALPTQDPLAAADELERTVTQLGFKGAMIHGHTNGHYLDEMQFWILWERAEALGVPLYLHPSEPLPDQIKIYEGHYELLGSTWNWGVETATHALRIVFGGVFEAFPKASLILGHLGEMLPYHLTRLDMRWQKNKRGKSLKKLPSEYIKENVLITTSGNFSDEALLCAIHTIGADHILFSVDYPFEGNAEGSRFIEHAPLSETDREKICFRNAERLLRM